MGNAWNENAALSKDAYQERELKEIVTIHGVAYQVIDTVKQSPNGFQATAYQRMDTGNVEIAYRGTQAAGDWFRDDQADLGMVRSTLNAQLLEAEAFTERVLAEAKAQDLQYHHSIKVTVTGHSLRGTHAHRNHGISPPPGRRDFQRLRRGRPVLRRNAGTARGRANLD